MSRHAWLLSHSLCLRMLGLYMVHVFTVFHISLIHIACITTEKVQLLVSHLTGSDMREWSRRWALFKVCIQRFEFLILCHKTACTYTWDSEHSLRAVFKFAQPLFIKGICLTFILQTQSVCFKEHTFVLNSSTYVHFCFLLMIHNPFTYEWSVVMMSL